MDVLALKLVLTPGLIGAVSLAGRRWGPAVSGWLVGIPMTSGPVALFLALEYGTPFAAQSTLGTLTGLISVAVFCLAYGRAAPGLGWPAALTVALVAFFVATWLLQEIVFSLSVSFVAVLGTLIAVLWLLPHRRSLEPEPLSARPDPPRWEIPARMVLATLFVVLLTGAAATLGPRLAGLLSPFPIFAGILTVFTHRFDGPVAAIGLLRGALLGMFGFGAFFFVLALLIEPTGLLIGFGCSTLVSLAVQGVALRALAR